MHRTSIFRFGRTSTFADLHLHLSSTFTSTLLVVRIQVAICEWLASWNKEGYYDFCATKMFDLQHLNIKIALTVLPCKMFFAALWIRSFHSCLKFQDRPSVRTQNFLVFKFLFYNIWHSRFQVIMYTTVKGNTPSKDGLWVYIRIRGIFFLRKNSSESWRTANEEK